MKPQIVEQLRSAAEAVRKQAEGVELSFAEERASNAAALRAVLDAAEPALPAIVGKLPALAKFGGPRGIQLAATGPGLIIGATSRRLFAVETASAGFILAEAIWAGDQGAVAFGPVDAEDAASRYRAEDVAATILLAMAAQLDGNAPRRAQDARRRAARLRALATLVETVCEPGGGR